MFNNVVLDIAIGLVFIYLLYSLLATALNEFISLIFAYRHRMLEKGIEQMLDGKNISYYWWDKVINIFIWSFYWITTKKRNLVKKSSFFQTNAAHAKTTDATATNADDIYSKRRKLQRKSSLFAANITNHALYRRKSEQSILFKKPAYLSSSAFSDILLDILGGSGSRINASPMLMTDIKNFVQNKLTDNPDLKNILNIYIEQANGDIQKFKSLIETWFDDTMDRVSGWYKRQTTKVLFAVGLIVAIAFNVSTIDIVHKLSVNKDLREAMVQSASSYVSHTSDSALQDKTVKNKDSLMADVKSQMVAIKKLYNDSIAPVNQMMGLGWDSAILYRNFIKGKVNTDSLGCFNRLLQKIIPDAAFNAAYSSGSVLSATLSKPSLLVGFFITALAITLGAPFWFDLLNRFVNIRAGGNKPAEGSSASPAAAAPKQSDAKKPAPKSFA